MQINSLTVNGINDTLNNYSLNVIVKFQTICLFTHLKLSNGVDYFTSEYPLPSPDHTINYKESFDVPLPSKKRPTYLKLYVMENCY